MKILYLTSIYDFNDKGNLYTDLVDEIVEHGHTVVVMTPKERKYNLKSQTVKYGENIILHQFKCLNFRGAVNVLEKGLGTLSLGYQYLRALKKHFKSEKFDMAIYATLPITYTPVIKYLKRQGTFCYLLHKDFFPQSAVDLEMMSTSSLSYKLFRGIEKGLYANSDKIGVMTPKNVEFITSNNPWLEKEKVEECPNGIKPLPDERLKSIKVSKNEVRSKYGIPTDTVVFIYGGIISRAQGVDFIESVFLQLKKSPVKNAYFLLIGSGNESERLNKYITELRLGNVKMMPFLPKKEYDEIQGCADVGMIFLDKRFTIANIPSRTLSYMDMGLAIVAGTDTYTDYRELVEKNEVGLWCSSDNPVAMVENIRRLTDDKIFRDSCSKNSRNYLLNNWTTEIVYNIIRKSFDSFKKK